MHGKPLLVIFFDSAFTLQEGIVVHCTLLGVDVLVAHHVVSQNCFVLLAGCLDLRLLEQVVAPDQTREDVLALSGQV